MNAEQKERAKDALTNCQASDMAALLQELVDAPEADPFAVIHLDGSFVHVEFKQTVAGTGKFEVYAAPPVQSVPEPEPFGYFKSEPFGWTDCAETDDGAIALYELPPAPEPVAYATGYYGGYLSIATVDGRVLPAGTALYAAQPAPSVPDGWRSLSLTDVEWMNIVNFDRAYSSYDKEEAVNEAVKRTDAKLKELNAAPTPAEAPADVARDAALYCAAQRACAELPEGWEIRIELERSAGTVILVNPDGEDVDYSSDHEYMASDINDAIDAAIEREKIKGGA